MNRSILHIDSISKSFVKKFVNTNGFAEGENFSIINNLNLQVPCGKITALIGGNGAGKTTLFNIISGFSDNDSGKVLYQGNGSITNITGKSPDEIARMGVGRMFQDNHIFQNMSVLENMLISYSNNFGELPFIPFFKSRKNKLMEEERTEKAKEIFENLFGTINPFWEKRNEKAKILSYGQQRLLGLARLWMGNYKLLLLDEPTAGVNRSIISQSMEIIKSFVTDNGLSVFMIEHNMRVVLDIADLCCFMANGKITAIGSAETILGNHEVRKSYMGSKC